MTDLYDRIVKLRAIRTFADRMLTDEDLDRILEAARWTGTSKNNQAFSLVVVADPDQKARLAECGDFMDPVRNAPLAVVLVKEPAGNDFDIGRVAQNIMLGASAIGVASCPVTLHRSDDAARVLGLPEDRHCRWGVALGYPTGESAPARWGGRRPLAELVHRDRHRGDPSPSPPT
jgi:nitroreductase